MRNTEDLYRARLKEFKNGKIKLREYKNLMWKPKKKEQLTSSTSKKRVLVEGGKISRRSLAKTRNTLIELVENNEDVFKSFITLTFKEDIEDIDTAYKDLQNYLKGCKRELKNFSYIAVPEIQHKRAKKSGKYVIHFHLITNIEIGTSLIPERETKTITGADFKGTKQIKYYDLKHWKKGFSIALPIIHQGEFELSKYLLKYLYKDLDNRFYGRQKLLHSNSLKVPEIQYYLEDNKINQIKDKNKENLNEVFSMLKGETTEPFTDYIYQK